MDCTAPCCACALIVLPPPYQDFVDTFFLELEGELRVEETVTKVRALTLKNTLLSGDVAVTIGGKVRNPHVTA